MILEPSFFTGVGAKPVRGLPTCEVRLLVPKEPLSLLSLLGQLSALLSIEYNWMIQYRSVQYISVTD